LDASASQCFTQNFFGAVQDGKLRMFFGQERVGLVDYFDLARVAAAVLREPTKHAEKYYFLSVEALTMPEAAQECRMGTRCFAHLFLCS
jgi:uncharacterized protein YbjT (DUF2867 family)